MSRLERNLLFVSGVSALQDLIDYTVM